MLSFITESERKRSNGTTYLKKWFEADNLKRYFMYRSKEALVTLAAAHFGKRVATTMSFDRLVDQLLEFSTATENNDSNDTDSSDEEEAATIQAEQQSHGRNGRGRGQQQRRQEVASAPVINEVIKAVMKKSFMKHLKGNAREHCQMGHKLELPIGRDFMRDLNEKKKLGDVQVVSLHKVGLVGGKK